jgi:hypothetical protein
LLHKIIALEVRLIDNAIAFANNGGTAFQFASICLDFVPLNIKLSGKIVTLPFLTVITLGSIG